MATIALDARLTRQMSVGMKAYVKELVARLPRLAPEFTFLVFSNEALEVDSANATLRPVERWLARNGGIGEQVFYGRRLARAQPDLVHYMSVYAPRLCGLPHVYTIHDLIHLRFPEYFSWKVPPYYGLVVGAVARSARFVITDARATVGDLQRCLDVTAARTRVVPLGVAEAFVLDERARMQFRSPVQKRLGLERAYFVYAGNHRPHKNIRTLVEGWRMTQTASDLVLTEEGPFDFDLDSGAKANGRIVRAGRISQAELIALYAGCRAAVQPSLYEGFGLGALEAMSAGAPVIVARTPALLELTHDAALSFPAMDAAALAAHMDALGNDPSLLDGLRAKGRTRARDFSWDITAKLTARVYHEALGQ